MKTGIGLIKEINNKKLKTGQLAFWWLGQHSFVVKIKDMIIYLDPFLTAMKFRQVAPLLKPEQVKNAGIITGSHDHADHIDRKALPGMMKASPNAILIVPKATLNDIKKLDIDSSRIRGLDDNHSIEVKNVKITAIKAAHEFFDRNKNNEYPFLSYILETDGITIFHAGDTCVYDGYAKKLQEWKITVAFIPINGRDAKRLKAHCIGNMTYQEAVDLAGSIRPALTVPAHYEMFATNSENPALFADYMDVKYPDLKYWIGKHGECVVVENK